MGENNDKMALTPLGFFLLLAGFLIMVLGYALMTGGGSDDPQVFNQAMFDARRLIVAPVTIVVGVIVEIVAIMGWVKPEMFRKK